MIRKLASGIYDWLPLGLRVLRKVENIIRQEMNGVRGQEVWLPLLLPKELWEETGRWNIYGKELFRLKDRKDADFCLGPTHEEAITDLARREIRSYRQLPVMFYQFGTKFRDEIRPRFGVMRAREFYMKDGYSFHADEKDAEKYYQEVYEAYARICKRCGFTFRAVEAATGAIGGSFSHEFMVLAETGEEEIVWCDCGYGANVADIGKVTRDDRCKCCGKQLSFCRGIEVGHTFKLGLKYSKAMNAAYLDADGKENLMVMGCYGIGVSRIVAATIEQSNDANGIIWPVSIAPFQVVIIPVSATDENVKQVSETLYSELLAAGVDVLIDDRDERAGVKFKDADLIGIPVRVTIGDKNLKNGNVELKLRRDKQDSVKLVPVQEIKNTITKYL
jgi:prolyl-tRNA synthetase